MARHSYNVKSRSKKYQPKNHNVEEHQDASTVKFTDLYRYYSSEDKFLLILSIIMTMIVGVIPPLNMLVFRSIINILVGSNLPESYLKEFSLLLIYFAIIAGSAFIAGFVQYVCLSVLSVRVGKKFRYNYFCSLIRQDIEWFDKQQTGSFITNFSDGIETIQTATTDKLVQLIQQFTTFISGVILGFVIDWRLTLLGLVALPLLFIVFGVIIRMIKKFAILQMKSYGIAGGIAEEILSGLRAIISFNAQSTEIKRYVDNLKTAEKYGVKRALCQGIAGGCIGFTVWSVFSLVYYMGLRFYAEGTTQPGNIVLITLTVILGSIAIGNTVPNIDILLQAKVSADKIIQVIDMKPKIDYKKEGKILSEFDGDIVFNAVNFRYPTRPDVQVLKNFNVTIKKGQTVAFIGPSGSGKSTVIHLLQRFYDPESGSISLNGTDLRELDLNWFRSNIGVVQQEPKLFIGTVSENIKLGKLNASYDEVVEAAKRSNAYDFIMKTRKKFNTKLGDMGSGFSGGQKQRLAIACALIRKPSLLLLDEATSALDNVSERIVQETIDREIQKQDGVKKTVVMVAHRLQTVRNADVIVVMRDGEIVEQGNHAELMDLKGLYWKMLDSNETKKHHKEYKEEEQHITKLLKDEKVEQHQESSSELIKAKIAKNKKKMKRFQSLYDFIALMKMNRPEAHFIVIGLIASIINGAVFPCCSLLIGELYNIFRFFHIDRTKFWSQANLVVALLLLPAFTLLVCNIIKNYCFGVSGEALTTRLREKLFGAILKQEMAWLDLPSNQPGILAGRLALEASQVKNASGPQMAIFIEAGSSLLAMIIIGFIFSWQITLVCFIFVPMIIVTGVLQGRNVTSTTSAGSNKENYKENNKSAQTLLLETLNNIRNVQSLGIQEYVINKFNDYLKYEYNSKCCKTFLYGLFGGIGVSALVLSYTFVFLVGAVLMDQKKLEMIQLMRVFSVMSISAASIGRAIAYASDVEKGRKAARKTLKTLSRESLIDPTSDLGLKPNEKLNGKIEFSKIDFFYPSRPNILVLDAFNLDVKPGETMALVGHSGCGKSTIIQLLERFYDPVLVKTNETNDQGSILIDGYDIKTLNVAWLRSQMGLVSQEPTLFNVTVRQNIGLGIENTELIDEARMIKVAKMANIHDFIQTLPQGYDTKVGQRGGHLSGGQRQRICIARALYREPKILLLDEATSALDQESESIVQEAVEAAQQTCTSITIAHRLTTVQNSDRIAVLENGHIKEIGSHQQLINEHPNGIYANLLNSNMDNKEE